MDEHLDPDEANEALIASILGELDEDEKQVSLREPSTNYNQEESGPSEEEEEEILLVQ